jgi:two-component system sensor histidine kinase AtoS
MRLYDRFDRWLGAAVGFALGAADTVLFLLLGTEFSLEGRDVTLLVSGAFTSSLVALGYLFGSTVEMRRRERASSEALDRARDQIAQSEKLATLGQLAGAIAHEVKNPLAIIRSSVQNLTEDLPDEGSASESARFAIEEIDRLTRVTNSLLAFARPVAVQRRKTSCAAILTQTELLAARMLSDRSIVLETNATVDAALEADADLVCQVLLGLLGNAAEVTPAGGTIRLEGRAEGEDVELAVADRGPGVPREIKDRIFEPFFTTRSAGTGLGLAVARQIVEAHGGKIAVEDREGGGARFSVRLRRAA